MEQVPFTLLAEAGSASLASRILAAAIWTGLGVLTISLLILMRTRWGQAKPISKCIALSVFAHILFLTYAYTTRLIFDSPAAEGGRGDIRVALSTTSDSDVSTRPTRPWAEVPPDIAVAPELLSPDRVELPSSDTSEQGTSLPDFPWQPNELSQSEVGLPPTPAPMETRVEQPREPVPSPVHPPLGPIETAPTEQPRSDPAVAEMQPSHPNDANTEPAPPSEANAAAALSPRPPPKQLQYTDIRPIGEATASQVDITRLASSRSEQNLNQQVLPQQPGEMEPVRSTPQRPGGAVERTDNKHRAADGAPLPKIYELRRSRDRLSIIELNGGSRSTEQAVESALAWLARSQEANGRWDPQRFQAGRETRVLGHDRHHAGINADTGITGLALLTFLAGGHTHDEGEYRETVRRAIEFLVSKQAADGNLAGDAKLFARMYCHGMATLAVSEALAMTGDRQLRPRVERAVRYTLKAQDPSTGGWRYQLGDRDGDMSQFGWQVMSLKSAEMAGIAIPSETRSGMLRFLRSVSKGQHRGLASYRPGDRPSRTMTAEALACCYFLNVNQDYRSINEATRYLTEERPSRLPGKPNLYYWYYATLALRQSESTAWRRWNESLQQALLSRQETDGEVQGSWNPETVWGAYGGRVYSTSLATLCLQVYYRYLPVYQVDDGLRSADRNWQPARTLR
ncbi:MAG: hypothetical protein CMJ64_26820 [Planctomycetaceae bacterium]|nr:hypothetical protein [Planctomycetaceae bacterium]